VNLTATTHTLELITAAATAVIYAVSWTDIDKSGASTVVTPGSAQGSIAAATTTTIVPAPGASIYRVITSLAVKATGSAQTVTAQKDVSGTNYPLPSASLALNESLHYEDANGWYVLDATGSRKGVGATGAAGVNGGGTVLGSGTSIVDFGAAGAPLATVTVTGQAALLAGSLVYCWIKPEATTDHSAGEHIVEDIKVVAADIVAGVGFTIYALSPGPLKTPDLSPLSLLGPSSGTGQAFGKGQPDRGLNAPVPGRAAVLTGKWSVGWFYTQ
jgi:hypothetical protein